MYVCVIEGVWGAAHSKQRPVTLIITVSLHFELSISRNDRNTRMS